MDQDPSTQITLDTLLANIIHSSAIEGEKLNAFSVRSSLANKLGVNDEKPFPTTVQTDGLAEMTLDALQNWQSDLTLERILGWHHLLFPEGYTLFNHSRHDTNLDPLIRAAMTHLWFVTLHPLDDGNGRITRLLTDLALAQAESRSIRFYAMSVSILERRQAYYEMLETSQKGELNITTWLIWFLDTLNASLHKSLNDIAQTVSKTNYWQRVDQTLLNHEQIKVLNRLLDGDFINGISSSQYQKVAKVSRATATRHLAQLVEQEFLVKADAGGRSTRYLILTS